MDIIAKHLATIDRLCAQEFPAEPSTSGRCTAGPGYFTVELETDQELTADDFDALRQGIAERLNDRLGEQLPWGQLTMMVRMERGEEIPEPWARLAVRTDALDVWQTPDTGRWIALGVADRDDQDEIQLLVTVTETDPP
ncbi:hypothetical protein [Streptomyces sp. STR69]|uniref:hypothetical protein n=1 Tax=Streptomyces sp. STR69 TaxID=1796942 RepID=UPI0021C58C2B|nr:hypothetical protein [Streptomyces sp. STR69]